MGAVELFAPCPLDRQNDCFRIRYQAFCIEQDWEPRNDTGMEWEAKDGWSMFVLIDEGSKPVATCRVTPLRYAPDVAEISRVAIVKACVDRRTVRRLIVEGITQISRANKIKHWFSLMEPRFIQLNKMYGLSWETIGPPVEVHGKRMFCYMRAP